MLKTRFDEVIAEIASGEQFGCMALTEPGAGSDLGAIRTKGVLGDDGRVRCWGHNGAGQLGDGTQTERHLPVDVGGTRGVAGDANCDAEVNSIDAALALQRNAGLTGELPCEENADVDGDGEVSSIDAALILQFVAGLLAGLPP